MFWTVRGKRDDILSCRHRLHRPLQVSDGCYCRVAHRHQLLSSLMAVLHNTNARTWLILNTQTRILCEVRQHRVSHLAPTRESAIPHLLTPEGAHLVDNSDNELLLQREVLQPHTLGAVQHKQQLHRPTFTHWVQGIGGTYGG